MISMICGDMHTLSASASHVPVRIIIFLILLLLLLLLLLLSLLWLLWIEGPKNEASLATIACLDEKHTFSNGIRSF